MAPTKDDALTREGAGNWRTKDGRFLIRGESGGHWYLVDDARHDAFGLELVSGPYATVAAAREAIARARADYPEGSAAPEPPEAPAARGAPAAREAPAAPEPPEAPAAPEAPSAAEARAAPGHERPARTTTASRDRTGAPPKERRFGAPKATKVPAAPGAPRDPEWMQDLAPAARRAARTLVRELDRLGIEGGGDLVRRDVTEDTPAVARAILVHRLASIVARATDPAAARAIVADVLRLVTSDGRLTDDAVGLPGWHLVEVRGGRSGGPGRPITVEADDLDDPPGPAKRHRG